MTNQFDTLQNEIIDLIYEFDDNEYNKSLFNKVIVELNKKRFIQFITYTLFDDNKCICNCKRKISKVYIMDMMDNNNIDNDKYADYDIQLNQWFHPSDKAIMSKCVKSEIAKHFY